MSYLNSSGHPLRGRTPKPWYRASTNSWYVCLDGRQVRLGQDQALANEEFARIRDKLGLKENPTVRKIYPATKKKKCSSNQFVYFIKDVETKNIKIGIASCPKLRLSVLQCGNANELILLGAIRGLPGDELDLHRKFADFRIRGEWFRYDDSIISTMNELIEQYEPYQP